MTVSLGKGQTITEGSVYCDEDTADITLSTRLQNNERFSQKGHLDNHIFKSQDTVGNRSEDTGKTINRRVSYLRTEKRTSKTK